MSEPISRIAGPIKLALFGSPVAHSLSPQIHQAFADQFDISIDYRKLEAGPETFGRRLQTFVDGGGRGCNVTVPLKSEAWELASRASRAAQRARAANTLLLDAENDWFADNTDGTGLIRDLGRRLEKPLAGQRVLLLGAGGAARGVIGALLEQGPAELTVTNRTFHRAERLLHDFRALGPLSVCAADELRTLKDISLVINATSIGHRGQAPVLPAGIFVTDADCYDLNYGPAADPLARHCRQTGLNFHHGLGMLVEQAAESFRLWFGELPDTDAVISMLEPDTRPELVDDDE